MTGKAGKDIKGLYIDDKEAGFKFRIGEVSMDLASRFAELNNRTLTREALSKPLFGFSFSKTF